VAASSVVAALVVIDAHRPAALLSGPHDSVDQGRTEHGARGAEGRGMSLTNEPIRTRRLILRPFVMSDLDDLHALHRHPDVARYLSRDRRSRGEVRDVLRRRMTMTQLADDGDGVVLAVARTADGRVIGEVSLWLRSADGRRGEIGFAFHPDAQGNGYAHEAVAALLDVAFTRLRMAEVHGRADSRNTGSATLMVRLGMAPLECPSGTAATRHLTTCSTTARNWQTARSTSSTVTRPVHPPIVD
jgi:RimJ/RimL family protein N-acetyltransferase